MVQKVMVALGGRGFGMVSEGLGWHCTDVVLKQGSVQVDEHFAT